MTTMETTKQVDALVERWRELGPIGWAQGVHGWIGITRQPITLLPWQHATLLAWWAHRQRITTLAVSNIKKTGKTFLDAVLLAWRWLALPGLHFAVANDLDQSAGRQFLEIAEMVRRNPYLRANVKAGKNELLFKPTDSRVVALAVDAAGNAGANHLTASHTETWGIVYEGGKRAFEELTPPPGMVYGFPALRICDSYAGWEGESNIWHEMVDRGLQGEKVSDEWPIYMNKGLMLFHIDGENAQRRCFRGTAQEAQIYYSDQRPTLRPSTFDRLHLNKRASGEEAFISMDDWDSCVNSGNRPCLPNFQHELFVGVDGSIKHDSSAVVAVYYDSETERVVLARHRIWQPSAHEPLDIDKTIGEFLRELCKGYSISEVLYDPYQLHDLSMRLRSDGLPMAEYAQSQANLTAIGQNLFELIQAKNLVLYPDDYMRTCVSHAIAVQSSRGWRIAKEKTAYKIDVVVALAMAALAAVERGSNQGWAWGAAG